MSVRFGRKNLYGLDMLEAGFGPDVSELILTITEWWDEDGSVSEFGSWFLAYADDVLYLTEEGVEYLDRA